MGNPTTLTVEEPTLTTATCGAQGGAGGKGCDIVLSVFLAIKILFAKTVLWVGVSNIVVYEKIWPVANSSPFLLTAGITLF